MSSPLFFSADFAKDPLRREGLKEAASSMFIMFNSFIEAGFTEKQAIAIVVGILTGKGSPQDGKSD